MSRAHPVLAFTSLAALGAALILALTPLGDVLGFVPLTFGVSMGVLGLVVAYLVSAEFVKRYAAEQRTLSP